MGINTLQNQYGGQQQALQQQGLSQAYQDFQNQQNYPYKQLGFMSDLIRGLPLGQQSTKAVYEPGPSTAQNIASLGLGAYGIGQMFKAEGGSVKSMAGGGLGGSVPGGSVLSREYKEGVVDNIPTNQGLQAAVEIEEKLKWDITAAELRVEIWRTEQANNRAEGKATM
jgi:hypothetical protein